MNKVMILITLLLFVVFSAPSYPNNGMDEKGITFPQMEGWILKGTAAKYNPETLYEYINGAADVFLSYDFKELDSLSYELEKDQKLSFTVDIYLHSSDKNGFGIYSQEKPKQGTFLSIGTQGYYEKGILNFLKGPYYVKISGYDLGDNDYSILTSYAEKLAEQLVGTAVFPKALACFPVDGKVAGSEGFIAQSFLGHAFLGSAFVADYLVGGEKIQVFIIETDTPKGVDDMIAKYMELVEKKGLQVELKDNIRRFIDPYYRNNGKMIFKSCKNYLWGLFSKDEIQAESMIGKIEANLKQQNLL